MTLDLESADEAPKRRCALVACNHGCALRLFHAAPSSCEPAFVNTHASWILLYTCLAIHSKNIFIGTLHRNTDHNLCFTIVQQMRSIIPLYAYTLRRYAQSSESYDRPAGPCCSSPSSESAACAACLRNKCCAALSPPLREAKAALALLA